MEALLLIAVVLLFAGGSKSAGGGTKPVVVPPPNPNNFPDLPTVDDPVEPTPTVFIPGVPEPPHPQPPPPPNAPWPTIYNPQYPTPGSFYTIVSGDTFLGKGIAFKALASAMYAAAKARGDSHEQALQRASTFANNEQHRVAYVRAIEGDATNDHLYGTYGYGPQALPNPTTKRAIRLLPQNADNAERIANGLAPIRSVKLSTPNNAKQGTGTKAPGAPGGHFETLWLPPINGDYAYDTGSLVVNTEGPPQWVRALGVDDRSSAPAGTKWGAS